MKIVLDTNLVVSGLLHSQGNPGQVLALALTGGAKGPSTQREIADLPLPLARHATFGDQEQVFDGSRNRHRRPGLEQTRHGLASLDPRVGECGQRGNVLAYQHPALPGSPSQNGRVIRTAEAHVGNADYIKRWIPTDQAANDVVIEILVEGESDHLRARGGR